MSAAPTSASPRADGHLAFWGKARPAEPPPYPPAHPVAYHLLDVAATMQAVLRARPAVLARGAALLGLAEEDARRLLVALAGLHDLGKFTPCFQSKVPELVPPALRGARVLPGLHTRDGMGLWSGRLGPLATEALWPAGAEGLDALAPAVFGHHGTPVDARRFLVGERFGAAGEAAALDCASRVLALLCPSPLEAGPISEDRARVASWWVAGLMTVADWIGSGQKWFRYTAPLAGDDSLAAYGRRAGEAAEVAVREAGLSAPAPAPRRSFARLVGLAGAPSPLQRWADEVPLPEGPVLLVLEDVTGAGKTEAAQVLVHRLMAAGRAGGAFWAMPTQATANAMYVRQARFLSALFADDAAVRPSLVLAHGQQRLHAGFRATVLAGAASAGEGVPTDDADELPAGASCAAFLADDRRAALLADVGAGTVDQALLGVLPVRFGTVRLFGLADRVLVVDEAHAYDAYMSTELLGLLRFHAALGGSAVVLSATLSLAQRRALVDAWGKGLAAAAPYRPEAAAPTAPVSAAYPLATVAAAGGAVEVAVEPAPWSRREVAVRLVHGVEAAVERVARVARAGGAAVWIRNTVRDCLEGAALLRDAGVERVMVFHARFAQCDRQAREAEVLARFGTEADAAERAGWALVATQVVEQSLDLDFDAMVSDLAPVDLLIQRAGRLQRHPARDGSRPAGCPRELTVLSPHPDDECAEGWMGGVFRGTSRVYENVAVLWRTARTLRDAGAIRTPAGLRGLIEAVYGEAAEDPPPALERPATAAEGRAMGHVSTAHQAVLREGDGYSTDQAPWIHELRARTRLGEDAAPLRLARLTPEGALAPWSGEPVRWKAWALSEVRVRAAQVPPDAREEPHLRAAADAARREWGRFEQEIPLLALSPDPAGGWTGALQRGDGRRLPFRYDAARGLAEIRPA